MIKTLLRTFKLAWVADRFYVVTLVLSSIVKSSMRFLTIYSIKLVIDGISSTQGQDQKVQSLAIAMSIFAGAWLVNNVVAHFKEYLAFIHLPKINNYLEVAIIMKSNMLPTETLETEDFHNIYTNIQTFGKQKFASTLDSSGEFVQSVLNFVYTLIIIFSSNYIVGLIIIFSAMIEVLYQSSVSRKLKSLQDEVTVARHKSNYFSQIAQDTNNHFNFKSYDLISFFANEVSDLNKSVIRKLKAFHIKFKIRAIFAGSLGNLIGTFAPIYYFGYQAIIGKISVGDTSFYLQIVQEFYRNTFVLYATFNSMYENSLYISDLFKYLDLKEIDESVGISTNYNMAEIKFENVSMKYHNSSRKAVENISFTVNPGEKVAIVGNNGAGKTTIIKLLTKFYKPSKGRITINNTDIQLLSSVELRRNIAYMNQDNLKIFMTLKDNIMLGNLLVDDEKRYENSVQHAELIDDITQLRHKDQTVLGNVFKGGQEISGGQWQKVNLARSFYKEAPILVLDEPTSSIDSDTEAKIFDKLFNSKFKKTIIVVSHKFSTINRADRIIVLDRGKIVGQGTHKELLAENGLYARLYKQQSEAFSKNN